MSQDKLVKNHVLNSLFEDIKTILNKSRQYAVTQVNQSLILGYWHIGKLIKEEMVQERRAEYGNQTIKKLSEKLTLAKRF